MIKGNCTMCGEWAAIRTEGLLFDGITARLCFICGGFYLHVKGDPVAAKEFAEELWQQAAEQSGRTRETGLHAYYRLLDSIASGNPLTGLETLATRGRA